MFVGVLSINPYTANVENRVSTNNARKWYKGFNSAFKGLMWINVLKYIYVHELE